MAVEHDVKNMDLATGGRYRIEWAEREMPVLRSIREPQATTTDWCARSRTGFEPMPADAERSFSFWSVRTRPEDGRVVHAMEARAQYAQPINGGTIRQLTAPGVSPRGSHGPHHIQTSSEFSRTCRRHRDRYP